ncbi:MAG: Ig-like domain-containing protein [Gemmatimonadota bacterium]|nr:Ig-like domain-containing protein [Gemmatimonadota bacterium]
MIGACADPPLPSRIEISPSLATADVVGATIPYTARVIDQDEREIVGAAVSWSSLDPRIATISQAGLATVTGQGEVTLEATHQALSASALLVVELKPVRLAKVAGDGQTAPALSILPDELTVRVEDGGGAPIPDVLVTFEIISGGGQIVPRTGVTGVDGEASTRWTLGDVVGPQSLQATAGLLEADFVVTATAPLLAIRTLPLKRARVSVGYSAKLEVVGGTPPLVWSADEGSLPPGLQLDSLGVISGTAAVPGFHVFTVHVQDAMGNRATGELGLRVCEPPMSLEPGGVVALEPLGLMPCPPFLPAGLEGDLYRMAVVRTDLSRTGQLAQAVVSVIEHGAPPATQAADGPETGVRRFPELPAGLAAGVELADATARWHAMLHEQAEQLLRQLGPGWVLPDLRGAADNLIAPARVDPPAERLLFRPYDDDRSSEACRDPAPALTPALLVAYNDHLAIYQDSAQRDTDPIRTEDANQVLDYYTAYGADTIEEYFGGVPDINGDGRVNVFVSPTVEDSFAAFVWAGDFIDAAQCSWSNQMELIYFNENMFHAVGGAPDDGHYQALPTMVHEMKHVSSLYLRSRAGRYHPSWIEEGTAEIAAEISSRRAMEAVGGVAQGALLTREAYPPRQGSIITPENYGMLLRLARTSRSYAAAVNSLVVDPVDEHTLYGTSWHFHRFLGDAYGRAAASEDGAFFRSLNDTTAPPGAEGIRLVTGKSVEQHLEDYAAAMMLNGTEAPPPEHSFTTYDFRSATFELFRPDYQPEGLYPWPHTGPVPAGFETATYSGDLAPAGIRFHDFVSDGDGDGLDVEVSVSRGAARIVIVRLR